MSDLYRVGGHDPRNLPRKDAEYRRQVMDEIVAIDIKNNVPISARPHHNVSNWILILACLPPQTEEGVTLDEIYTIINDMEYSIRRDSVKNALYPMLSKNKRIIDSLSKITKSVLYRIGGIQQSKINEDGHNVGSYTLGINTKQLETLVNNNEFITYSFNLNGENAIRLMGGVSNINS